MVVEHTEQDKQITYKLEVVEEHTVMVHTAAVVFFLDDLFLGH